MANCIKCGAELAEGAKFCTTCGTNQTAQAQPDLADKILGLNNTADTTADYDKKDIEDNKIMAILAYIGILFLVPLLAAKDSKFARFHTSQGLVLFLLGLAGALVLIIPILGWLVSALVFIATLVLMILGIINVCQGKAKELPIIGKINLLK